MKHQQQRPIRNAAFDLKFHVFSDFFVDNYNQSQINNICVTVMWTPHPQDPFP